jgi:hypothetical protein
MSALSIMDLLDWVVVVAAYTGGLIEPLWQDYRFQAAAFLALTGAVVMAFR